jgi:hypothetical protein
VAVDGGHAYLAAGTPFFQTVDLNLPTAPVVVGDYPASVADLRVRGDRAYVAAGSPARLQILDVGDAQSPAELGSAALAGAAGVAISGDYAVVAGGSAGLFVVDVSDEGAPVAVGTAAPVAATVDAVEIRGDHVYAAGAGGMQVFDIADPTNPVGVALFDSDPGGMKDLVIRGSRAYVVDGAYFQPTSLRILDVSDPTAPSLMAKVPGVAASLNRLAVSGGHAFITDSIGGMLTVNVDPSSGDYLQTYGPYDQGDGGNFSAGGVAAFGDYAFVSSSHSGLTVVDVSDPANPVSVASTGSWGGQPGVVRLYGGSVFVAGGSEGLKIVRLRP